MVEFIPILLYKDIQDLINDRNIGIDFIYSIPNGYVLFLNIILIAIYY